MTSTCRHRDVEELQDDAEFVKLSRWTRSSNLEHPVANEMRQAKVFRLQGDMDAVSVGLPRHERFQGERVALRKDLMPSATGRGVRMSCFKVERAALYAVRAEGSGPKRGPRVSQVINEEELAKALASIGE